MDQPRTPSTFRGTTPAPAARPEVLISSRQYLLSSASAEPQVAWQPIQVDAAASLSDVTLGRCRRREPEIYIYKMQCVV